VGDGVADDTAAIQAAFNAAGAANKGVFFPSGNYRITATINTPSSCTITGEDKYLARINSQVNGDLFILGDNYTHIENLSILDLRIPTGYTAGTKAIVSKGNLTMTNVRIQGFDRHMLWASPNYPAPYSGSGGGFYYKFINCLFAYGNIILDELYGNNFTCIGCQAFRFVSLANINRGSGNFTWQSGSIEQWTGMAIYQSAGTPCNITIKDTYFEGCGTRIVVMTQGVLTFNNNSISTFGPDGTYPMTQAIVMEQIGSVQINLHASGNHWIWFDNVGASTLQRFYFFQAANNTFNNCIIEDSYQVTGTAGNTPPAFGFFQGSNVNFRGVDPITGKHITGAWKSLTMQDGWISPAADIAATNALSWKIIGSTLFIQGTIDGRSATGITICTLPAQVVGKLGGAARYYVSPGTYSPFISTSAAHLNSYINTSTGAWVCFNAAPYERYQVNLVIPL
jgi:hypothetical protein